MSSKIDNTARSDGLSLTNVNKQQRPASAAVEQVCPFCETHLSHSASVCATCGAEKTYVSTTPAMMMFLWLAVLFGLGVGVTNLFYVSMMELRTASGACSLVYEAFGSLPPKLFNWPNFLAGCDPSSAKVLPFVPIALISGSVVKALIGATLISIVPAWLLLKLVQWTLTPGQAKWRRG